MLFMRSKVVAPDSSVAGTGISKCTKTILNKLSSQDVFFFKNSKYFFDFLRKEGGHSVEKYLNNENNFKVAVAVKALTMSNSKTAVWKVVCACLFIVLCYLS